MTSEISDQPWRTLQRTADTAGLSVNALREYIKKGHLVSGYHFVKARNGRIMIHEARFAQWLDPTAA